MSTTHVGIQQRFPKTTQISNRQKVPCTVSVWVAYLQPCFYWGVFLYVEQGVILGKDAANFNVVQHFLRSIEGKIWIFLLRNANHIFPAGSYNVFVHIWRVKNKSRTNRLICKGDWGSDGKQATVFKQDAYLEGINSSSLYWVSQCRKYSVLERFFANLGVRPPQTHSCSAVLNWLRAESSSLVPRNPIPYHVQLELPPP